MLMKAQRVDIEYHVCIMVTIFIILDMESLGNMLQLYNDSTRDKEYDINPNRMMGWVFCWSNLN